jgi:hypothetical protein
MRTNHFRTLYAKPVPARNEFGDLRRLYFEQRREEDSDFFRLLFPNYSRELADILRRYARSKRRR